MEEWDRSMEGQTETDGVGFEIFPLTLQSTLARTIGWYAVNPELIQWNKLRHQSGHFMGTNLKIRASPLLGRWCQNIYVEAWWLWGKSVKIKKKVDRSHSRPIILQSPADCPRQHVPLSFFLKKKKNKKKQSAVCPWRQIVPQFSSRIFSGISPS